MMRTQTVVRILAGFLLVWAAFSLPWWCAFFGAFAAAIFFDRYYELLFIGILIDSLSAVPAVSFFGFHYLFSLISLAALVVASVLRKKLLIAGING